MISICKLSARDIPALLRLWETECGEIERRHFVGPVAVMQGVSHGSQIFVAIENANDDATRKVVGSMVLEFGMNATLRLFVARSDEEAGQFLALAVCHAADANYLRLLAVVPNPERCPWLPELGFEPSVGTWFAVRELTDAEKGEAAKREAAAKKKALHDPVPSERTAC